MLVMAKPENFSSCPYSYSKTDNVSQTRQDQMLLNSDFQLKEEKNYQLGH